MIYSLLLINALCTIVAYIGKGKYLKWSIAFLFLFLALRYDFGNDYMAYYNLFEMSYSQMRSSDIELGYALLNKLFHPLGFFSMQVFLAGFFCIVLYYSLKRYVAPQYYWLVVFSLISNADLIFFGASAIRQTIALTCIMVSMRFLEKKQIVLYMGTILLATSFHLSAILFIALYPLIYVDFSKANNLIILIVVSIAITTVLKTVFYDYLSVITEQHFEKYFDRYGEDEKELVGGTIGTIIRVIILLFFVYAMKHSSSSPSDRIRNVFMVMGFAAVIIFTMREQVMLQRYCMYFSYFFSISYSTVLERGHTSGKSIFYKCFIAMIIIWNVYMAFTFANGNKLFEYHTFLGISNNI